MICNKTALSSDYRPACGETMTVRLTAPETGEILTEKEIALKYKSN